MRKVEHQIIYITTKIPTMRMNETTVYQPFDIKIGFVLQSNFRSNVIYKMLLSSYNMDQIIVHLCWHDFVLFHAACFSKRQVNQNNNIQSFPSYTKQEKRTFSIRKYNFICLAKIITLKLVCNHCQGSKIPTKIAFNVQSIIGFAYEFYC